MYTYNSQSIQKLVGSFGHGLMYPSPIVLKRKHSIFPKISTEPLFYVRHCKYDDGLDIGKYNPLLKKKEYLLSTTLPLRQIAQNKIGLFDLECYVSHHCLL